MESPSPGGESDEEEKMLAPAGKSLDSGGADSPGEGTSGMASSLGTSHGQCPRGTVTAAAAAKAAEGVVAERGSRAVPGRPQPTAPAALCPGGDAAQSPSPRAVSGGSQAVAAAGSNTLENAARAWCAAPVATSGTAAAGQSAFGGGGGVTAATAAAAALPPNGDNVLAASARAGGPRAVAVTALNPRHATHPRRYAPAAVTGRAAAAGPSAADGVTTAAAAGTAEDAPAAAGAESASAVAVSGDIASGSSSTPSVPRPATVSNLVGNVRPLCGQDGSSSGASVIARVAATSGIVAAPGHAPAADGSVAGALGRVQEEFVCSITQVG